MTWLLLIVLIIAGTGIGYYYFTGLVRVPADTIGVVTRRIGPQHRNDRYKVSIQGSLGKQADVLHPDRLYFRPRPAYRVEFFAATEIPAGTIGVVYAKDGAKMPSHKTLADSVESDLFQDAASFLLNGGQSGRQPDVLGSGRYLINPYLFEVLTVDTIGEGKHGLIAADLREITIPEGRTGVVITNEGKPPTPGELGRMVPGHENFQVATAFLTADGQQGIQAQTLNEGALYRINPWFARVIVMPTREIILEWTRNEAKSVTRYDTLLDEIVLNVEGNHLYVTMSQTFTIPAASAPALLKKFGEGADSRPFGPRKDDDPVAIAPVQRFVDKVPGEAVRSYFHEIATEYKVIEFYLNRKTVRASLADRIAQELDNYGVLAGHTTIDRIIDERGEIDQLRREIALDRGREAQLLLQLVQARIKADIERVQLEVDKVRAELSVAAQAKWLQVQIDLLGRDPAAMNLFLKQLTNMNVPSVVGGNAEAILQYMPMTVAQNLINRVIGTFEPGRPPPSLSGSQDETGDDQPE